MRSIGLDVGRQFAEVAASEPGGKVRRLGLVSGAQASREGADPRISGGTPGLVIGVGHVGRAMAGLAVC
jgi:hypothetical protein